MISKIILEDKDILVCYKPSGMPTQTNKIGQMDLVSEMKNYLCGSSLGLINRLDQPVEGLVLFGKNATSTKGLNQQLTLNQIHKEYYACVLGKLPRSGQKIKLENFMKTDKRTNSSMLCSEKEPNAKKAILFYEVLENQKVDSYEISLIKVQLVTGRQHQIRLQFSALGYPLIGDYKYGSEESKKISNTINQKIVALCAHEIQFNHPISGKNIRVCERPANSIFYNFSL